MNFDFRESAKKNILVVAHRGAAAGNIPCNTIPAYEAALRQGADMIEIDVDMSRDGKLYIGDEEIMDVSDIELEDKVEEVVAEENAETPVAEEVVTEEAPVETVEEPENKERKVFVGIRPEGFIYDENGVLTLDVTRVEVMGRDKSIVSTHHDAVSETLRTIIDSDVKLPEGATQLRFSLKPNKVHIFDAETEERIK